MVHRHSGEPNFECLQNNDGHSFASDSYHQFAIVSPRMITRLSIAFGFHTLEILSKSMYLLEILFWLEIIINFFTAYKDTETFESINSLKKIATHYILQGEFVFHALSAFPYQLIFPHDVLTDPEQQKLRNVLMFKMLRLGRLNNDFVPDEVLLQLL